MRVCIYIDGSELLYTENNVTMRSTGWALKAFCEKFDEEISGAVSLPKKQSISLSGSHEIYAFIQAVLFAINKGIDFENIVLFSDDEKIGYAKTILHKENNMKHALTESLRKICTHFFKKDLYDSCISFLEKAFIHKVKSHSMLVYNERVDYLAKCAAKQKAGITGFEVLAEEDWLYRGFVVYSRNSERGLKYPAFCSPEVRMLQ